MQLSHSIQMMGTTIDILIDSDTPKRAHRRSLSSA